MEEAKIERMIHITLQTQEKKNITTINNEGEIEEDGTVVKLHHKTD